MTDSPEGRHPLRPSAQHPPATGGEAGVHPTAVVDTAARLASGVRVGPYAVIGADVELGPGTEVGAGAQIAGPASFGAENRIFPHACLGFDPQDLKYHGERSRVEVGDRNVFREFMTLHRGTELGGGLTSVGSDNLFMAYTHVAHDCRVGDRTIFGNCSTLAGHVDVGDDAILSAFCAVQQFCRIGAHAYIGGYSVITMDALPFMRTVGQKPVCLGVNRVGLKRRGFDDERLRRLERAYRILVRSGLDSGAAAARLADELGDADEDCRRLVAFMEGSERGVIRTAPGTRGSRGHDAG